jgi:acetolactate synthase-1/3 small subunit
MLAAVRAHSANAARRALLPKQASPSAFFATSARVRDSEGGNFSRRPRPIDDSTSALDYKRTQHRPPPPLPAMDLPRRSAEEAVTNILYNTPPPSLQPFKKHVLNCLVQNEPGVLSRVSGILAGRGFNIDSLVVCRTEIRDLSRMCIVLNGQDGVVEQARRQLEDLVPVWAVLDYTETPTIQRELLLAKVSILGPEYVEDQLASGPHHDPRDAGKFDRESVLAQTFESSGRVAEPTTPTIPTHTSPTPTTTTSSSSSAAVTPAPAPLTPSEALRIKHQHLQSISTLSEQFGARIVDVSENSVIVEMSGKTKRVEAFLSLLSSFGVLESARSGLMVLPRTPLRSIDEDDGTDLVEGVDMSLLPPG